MSVEPKKDSSPQVIICDTNIVLLMILFKSSIMFSAVYSFGIIKIHHTVISELEKWLVKNNRKVQKFTAVLIEDALKKCIEHQCTLRDPDERECARSHRFLDAKENSLTADKKGAATSKTDKDLLSLAYKHKTALATQERTMRSLAKITLGENRVLLFEDLILDLLKLGVLAKDDVKTGLETLDRMGESLDRKLRTKIESWL